MFDKLLIIICSIILSCASLAALGRTSLLSTLFGLDNVRTAFDILFIVVVVLFAAIFWYFIPRPFTLILRVLAGLVVGVVFFFLFKSVFLTG